MHMTQNCLLGLGLGVRLDFYFLKFFGANFLLLGMVVCDRRSCLACIMH